MLLYAISRPSMSLRAVCVHRPGRAVVSRAARLSDATDFPARRFLAVLDNTMAAVLALLRMLRHQEEQQRNGGA
jgi:hypothetical protein